MPTRLRCFLAVRLPVLVTWLAAGAFAAGYALQAALRHDSLGTNALDLGYEDQVLWNTLHGKSFQFSILSGGGFSLDFQAPLEHASANLLGYHAELLLAPLSLLYTLVPDVRAMLFLQASVVCAGAFAAFALARRRLGNGWAACFIALAYLSSPFIEAELLSDFHTIALDSALLLLLFYCVERRWLIGALVAAVAVAAAREDAPLAIMMLGIWAALVRRRLLLGAVVLLVGIDITVFDFSWLIPHFSSTQASPFLPRYGYLGSSPLNMLANVVRNPSLLGPTLGSQATWTYIQAMLGSTAGLALLSPLTLAIAAPSLAINTFSAFPWMRSGMAHYSALVLPVLVVASIEGIRNVAELSIRPWMLRPAPGPDGSRADPSHDFTGEVGRLRGWPPLRLRHLSPNAGGEPRRNRCLRHGPPPRIGGPGGPLPHQPTPPAESSHGAALEGRTWVAVLLAAVLGVSAAGTHFVLGAGPGGQSFDPVPADAHARLLSRFLAEIPPDDAVSASSALAPHLSHRDKLYLFPNVLDAQDILLDLTTSPFPTSWSDQRLRVLSLLRQGDFGVVDAMDGYVLLRRGAPTMNLPADALGFFEGPFDERSRAPLATFDGNIKLVSASSRVDAVLGAGWSESVTLDWVADGPVLDDLALAVWADGTPRPVSPDFAGETPSLVWRPTSSWQPEMVIRVTVPAVAVARPGPLQVGWVHTDAQGHLSDWSICTDAAGQSCPLGSHFVLPPPQGYAQSGGNLVVDLRFLLHRWAGGFAALAGEARHLFGGARDGLS